ncbi:hypothetical protein MKX03_003362 [Papaver bracteatum]|nr:hypothetical protein MKX03_003362 [Papaver bracteatum]
MYAVGLVSQGYVIQQTASLSSQVVDDYVVTDLEGNKQLVVAITTTTRPSFWYPAKIVLLKLARNPNTYATLVSWESLGLLSQIRLVTALPERVIACGTKLAVFSMVLRFFDGPAAMAVVCRAVGLHGDNLHIAVIQVM